MITDFKWNFGDGKTAETVIGFTSHTYAKFGIYTVTLTVENSGGGEDQVSVNIVVNGAPVLDLLFQKMSRLVSQPYSTRQQVTTQRVRNCYIHGTWIGLKTQIMTAITETMQMQ